MMESITHLYECVLGFVLGDPFYESNAWLDTTNLCNLPDVIFSVLMVTIIYFPSTVFLKRKPEFCKIQNNVNI